MHDITDITFSGALYDGYVKFHRQLAAALFHYFTPAAFLSLPQR
jgi:hypothetical protein